MAGDWIKMRTDLHDDPAVVMIASALKVSEDEVVGKLHRLWSWADRHTTDGTAPAITIAWIDRYVGRKGFADALILARWLEVTPDGIRIPKFDKHNGASAKSRAEVTERKRRSRECHAKSVTEVTREAGQVSQSHPPNSVTIEEKRRDITPISPPRFDEFWKAYPGPRKVGKAKCLKLWTANGLESMGDQILLHVAAMAATPQWREADGKFIPSPLTYLNQRRFEDGMPEQPRPRLVI